MSEEPAHAEPRGGRNALLATGIVVGAMALQWLAARQGSLVAVVAIGVVFSFLLLPLYSLLHEAEHRVFARDPRINDAFGTLLAAFFPGAFNFLRACHLGHHRRNRSDAEMFDLYYPTDSLFAKRAMFYALYLGGFWLMVPVATVVLVVFPRLLQSQVIQDAPSAAAMVNGIPRGFVRRIRIESAAVIALHAALFVLLQLRVESVLILYGLYGLNWSSQQYITHAHSPRHTLDGAHNLVAHPIYETLLLNFNWHLAHHQHPGIPWHMLPRHDDAKRTRPSYLVSFIRFWRGPQPVGEEQESRHG